MRRNAIAWAALVVSTAALIGSQNWIPTVPAAAQEPQIPQEGLDRGQAAVGGLRGRRRVRRPVGRADQRPAPRPLDVDRGSGRRPDGPNGQQMTPEELEEFMERFRDFFPDGGPGRHPRGVLPLRAAAVRRRGHRLGLRLRRPGPHPDEQPRRRGGRGGRHPGRQLRRRQRRPRPRSSAPTRQTDVAVIKVDPKDLTGPRPDRHERGPAGRPVGPGHRLAVRPAARR